MPAKADCIGKVIGRVSYGSPDAVGYVITRKWAIPENCEHVEMWWHRAEWLDATNDGEGGVAFVEVYEGGWSFMTKVMRRLKEKGWRVVYNSRARCVPYDVVLDRALYTA